MMSKLSIRLFFFSILFLFVSVNITYTAQEKWLTEYNTRISEYDLLAIEVLRYGNTAVLNKWLGKLKRANNRVLICARFSTKHREILESGNDCPCIKKYERIIVKLCNKLPQVPTYFTNPERLHKKV